MFTGLEAISCTHPGHYYTFPASYKILIRFAPGRRLFFDKFVFPIGLLFFFCLSRFPSFFSFFSFFLSFAFRLIFLFDLEVCLRKE